MNFEKIWYKTMNELLEQVALGAAEDKQEYDAKTHHLVEDGKRAQETLNRMVMLMIQESKGEDDLLAELHALENENRELRVCIEDDRR